MGSCRLQGRVGRVFFDEKLDCFNLSEKCRRLKQASLFRHLNSENMLTVNEETIAATLKVTRCNTANVRNGGCLHDTNRMALV